MQKTDPQNPGAKIGSLLLAIILWFLIKKMEETPSPSNMEEVRHGTSAR